MSDLVLPNIICFQSQKQLATLNNIRVLLKSVWIDLRARNFVHAKTLCMHVASTLVTVRAICQALFQWEALNWLPFGRCTRTKLRNLIFSLDTFSS